jgi:hypothetical protein
LRRGLLDGGFPTDRAVVYTFGLVLPKAHIPSAPKLQVQLRILEMRQLLQQARSKADAGAAAAATAEQRLDAANGDMASAVDRMEQQIAVNTAAAGKRAGLQASGSFNRAATAIDAAADTAASRTFVARRSARLAGKQSA